MNQDVIKAVHQELLKQNITVATAESCTGGALALAFVANPGASHYFLGSIVAYANSVKQNLLGIDPQMLEEHGAVSEEIAEKMALQVCHKIGSTLGIGVSGILGPSGGSPEKPVGTVCSSIAYQGKIVISWTMHLKGTRQHLLEIVVQQILAKVYSFLMNMK